MNHSSWKNAFFQACKHGQIHRVHELITHLDYAEFSQPHTQDDLGLMMACQHGHLEVVKYLLTSPDLVRAGHSYARLHADHDRPLRLAFEGQHFELIRYLLTSPDLLEAGHEPFLFPSIEELENEPMGEDLSIYLDFDFCTLDVIRFVFQSHELDERTRHYFKFFSSWIFESACLRHDMDLISWLVFEARLELHHDIECVLEEHPQYACLFHTREEHQALSQLFEGRADGPASQSSDIDLLPSSHAEEMDAKKAPLRL